MTGIATQFNKRPGTTAQQGNLRLSPQAATPRTLTFGALQMLDLFLGVASVWIILTIGSKSSKKIRSTNKSLKRKLVRLLDDE